LKRTIAVVLLAAAIPCASARALPQPVIHVAPLHLFRSGHIGVSARINGQGPFRLVLDTGSPITFVSNRVAKILGLPGGAAPAGGGMFGMGMSLNPFARVKSLDVGGAVVKDFDIMVLDHPVIQMLGTVEGPVDGIVGFTFFSRFRTTLDYAAKRVSFTPISFEPPDVMKSVFRALMDRNGTRRVVAPAALWGMTLEDGADGPVIKSVYDGSPAAESGLRAGDRIVSLDGRWVESTIGFFDRAADIRPGALASLVVHRVGRDLPVNVIPRAGL